MSCLEVDLLVDLVRSFGSDGSVFGGCTVSLVRMGNAARIANQMANASFEKTAIHPAILISRPAADAQGMMTK